MGDSLEVRLSLQPILGMQKTGQELKSVGWMYLMHWKDLGQEAVVEERNCLFPPAWQESFPRQKRWMSFETLPQRLHAFAGDSVPVTYLSGYSHLRLLTLRQVRNGWMAVSMQRLSR